MISVSRPYLPKLSEYNKYLKKIWKSRWLTNDGELVQELERKLEKYWGVKHVVCVSSGTTAIEIALKALDIQKEIYVSPFSFIATISAPMWMGIKPKFVDLGKEFKGPALVTHVYGIPYLTKARPVIYDASHAFATKVDGKSVLTYGDCSIISFHAVKQFHTVEGGAVVTNNDEIAKKARWMRNFGFNGDKFDGVGINAKMSEFHAAMGLCNLKNIDRVVKRYRELVQRYNNVFDREYENLTYYPLFFHDVKKAIKLFNKYNIYPRRYFYPALNTVFSKDKCPVLESLASHVLCLPLYYELTNKEQDLIIKIAKECYAKAR